MSLYYWILSMIIAFPIVQGQNSVVVLRAIKGEDARLPCGQGKVFLDGPDSFVLWVKNDRELLYRYPTEGSNMFDSILFSTNCASGDCSDDNTSLFLKHVNEKDAGIYSCRIHYQASPSVDYIIDLRLVESPGIPKIFTANGEVITRGVIGPFGLGSKITLNCEIENDQPETFLFWRRNGITQDSNNVSIREGVKCIVINVFNMTRDEQGARYECVAQNSDVSRPLVTGLVVKMFLPPLLVEIRLNDNLNFEAGQPRVVDCVVVGCIPPPSITWHLGNNMLRSNVHKELHDGNYTVSSLTLAPSFRDTNRQLVCQAHNSLMPEEIFQDNVTLNVGYRPVCATPPDMTVGIVEGEAEMVTCTVESSPAPIQFSWTFSNSRTLYTSAKKIVDYASRYSSSLLWVPQAGDIGELLCRATNIIGEQKQPCAYTITQGGPPVTPDCEMSKPQLNTIQVQCKKTWDGGRPQIIHLELLNGAGNLLKNVSNNAGNFRVPNVQDQNNITAVIYASNERGRSDAMVTQLLTKKSLKQQVYEQSERHWSDWLKLAAGVLSVTIIIIIIIKCIVDYRNVRGNRNNNTNANVHNDGLFHREPDFAREERIIGTTNITVNQVAPCQNDYSSTPISGIRFAVRCPEITASENVCPSSQHAYYV